MTEDSSPQPLSRVRSSPARRSGSVRELKARALPPLTVVATTAYGLPFGARTIAPGSPFTRTGVDVTRTYTADIRRNPNPGVGVILVKLVAGVGFEPTTFGL